MNNINNKVKNAAKWSLTAEVLAKLILPITNIILARLLTPEAFGIVATATMIFSFADIFTDAGFQNYIIQHEFDDDEKLERSTTVAFWSNLALSLFLWGIISIFNVPLAYVTGIEGYGIVFIVSCISLPITSLSSIQMALYKRKLDFKTLFIVRVVTSFLPLVVTVPLAFFTRSFWALIIGTISGNIARALILTVKSNWKPRWFYSFKLLQDMLSFSCWSLLESISIWLTAYIGTFLVGMYLSTYYIGIYKTSMNSVNQVNQLITTATCPILFSALSRLQNNKSEFDKMFLKFQRMVGLILVPIGVGIFLFQDLFTYICLGDQWSEAQSFIGLWGLTSSITTVLSYYSSEAFRAIGKPKVAVLGQWLHLVVLIPVLIICAQINFEALYTARSFVRFQAVLVDLILMQLFVKIKWYSIISNIARYLIASGVMYAAGYFLRMAFDNMIWQIAVVFLCMIIYFTVLFLFFPKSRNDVKFATDIIKNKMRKKT